MADQFGPEIDAWLKANADKYENVVGAKRISAIEQGLCIYMMKMHGLSDDDLEGILGPLNKYVTNALGRI